MAKWKLIHIDEDGHPTVLRDEQPWGWRTRLTEEEALSRARLWVTRHFGEDFSQIIIEDLSRVGARYAELPYGTLVMARMGE